MMPYGIQQIQQQQIPALKADGIWSCLFCMINDKCPTNVVGFCGDRKIKSVKVLLLNAITSVCFKAVPEHRVSKIKHLSKENFLVVSLVAKMQKAHPTESDELFTMLYVSFKLRSDLSFRPYYGADGVGTLFINRLPRLRRAISLSLS